ncbi:DNA-directed RNA polymerase [Massospora cicadina]|nr:DNA-directed RNA polymerase [Massospora cicadina]
MPMNEQLPKKDSASEGAESVNSGLLTTKLYEKQLKLEELAFNSAAKKMRMEAEMRDDKLLKINLSPLCKAMVEWKSKLVELIAQEQWRLVVQDDPEKEYHAEQMHEKTNRHLLKDQEHISQLYSSGKIFSMMLHKFQVQFERELIGSNWNTKWPVTAHVRVGSAVLNLLIDSATILVPGQKEATPLLRCDPTLPISKPNNYAGSTVARQDYLCKVQEQENLVSTIRSGNPEAYLCALPIHQDGTCNGLQHYTALGRDIEGARHANLLHSASPHDIYSEVLHHMNRRVDADAATKCPAAMALKGHITRKVIKQMVMVNVYGAIFFGTCAQILSQLKEISALTGSNVGGLRMYLTCQVIASIGETFSSVQAIQAWLSEQEAPMQLQIVDICHYDVATSINPCKQCNAFPPNFVHSLDASHMMMMTLAMQKENLFFASIHGSYWTHALSDILAINVLLDEDENELTNDPYELANGSFPSKEALEVVSTKKEGSNFVAWIDLEFLPLPPRGEYDLSQVAKSEYFFH